MNTVPTKKYDPTRINEISDKLMANPEIAKLIGELAVSTDDANELATGLMQAALNAGLQAEMNAHLGYEHSDREKKNESGSSDNHRNGSYTKTVKTGYGPVEVTMPRDRNGTFTPRMLPKTARRITTFDDMIISLYAGGMSDRDIKHHLASTLGIDISADTISTITNAVLDEVEAWQKHDLAEFYPVIFLDALRVKIRDNHRVVNKAVYMAIGVDMDGIKHILGLWVAKNEGAAFWAHVCADLSNRGVKDVFIVCCDGLKGLPEAIEATWPESLVQTCVVHLIRAANRWVSYADRKAVSAALRKVYTASSEQAAQDALDEFAASKLGQKYPQSVKVWRDAWDRFIPFLQFPPAARRVIYTTNSIESLNAELRKAIRNRGQFPSDEAAVKTLWLMICNIEDKRATQREKAAKRATRATGFVEGARTANWNQAINQMMVAYPERFAKYV